MTTTEQLRFDTALLQASRKAGTLPIVIVSVLGVAALAVGIWAFAIGQQGPGWVMTLFGAAMLGGAVFMILKFLRGPSGADVDGVYASLDDDRVATALGLKVAFSEAARIVVEREQIAQAGTQGASRAGSALAAKAKNAGGATGTITIALRDAAAVQGRATPEQTGQLKTRSKGTTVTQPFRFVQHEALTQFAATLAHRAGPASVQVLDRFKDPFADED